MLLTKPEIQQVLEQVKVAFTHFTNWEYKNEENEYYDGFYVWGEYAFESEDQMQKSYFVTFSNNNVKWQGYLTIGQHIYYWSSADYGDADLLSTVPCESLGQAIVELKAKMVELFRAFSAI